MLKDIWQVLEAVFTSWKMVEAPRPPKTHYFTIRRCLAESMQSGAKGFEARTQTTRTLAVQASDTVMFHWYSERKLQCHIDKVLLYSNIIEMCHDTDCADLVPNSTPSERVVTMLQKTVCSLHISFQELVVLFLL